MFHGISAKIVAYAVNNGYTDSSRTEIYIYGLELLLTVLFTDITVLAIGISMRMTLEAIIFWYLYKLLKKYVGGYHFNSQALCYLSTCIMTFVGLLAIRYCPYSTNSGAGITAFLLLTLFLLSPVPAENKPLDDKETKVFGRIAKVMVFAVTIIYSLTITALSVYISKVISVSLFFVFVYAVVGKINQLKVRQC